MKNLKFGSLSALLVLALLTSCLERQVAETAMAVSADKAEIVVPSDLQEGRNLVKDTLWVSCNRNWVADFSENVDWVVIDTVGVLNLSGATSRIPVAFSFLDNETTADRTVKLTLSSEAGKQEIPVRQKAISYRILITTDPERFSDLSYEADTVTFNVNSNTEWALAMKSGSINASLSKTSGKYSDEVKMYVAENELMTRLYDTLVLSSPNCPSFEIPVSQASSKPSVRFPEGKVITAMDGINDISITIKANADWTASIESVEGYDLSQVSVTESGTAADKSVQVTFPASIDFSLPKATIKVKFVAEGNEGEPSFATVEQIPALRYIFGNPYQSDFHSDYKSVLYDIKKAADTALVHTFWPFASYKTNEADGTVTDHGDGFAWLLGKERDRYLTAECTMKNGGYVLHLHGEPKDASLSTGICFAKQGFGVGAEVTSWIGAPVVPGRKLVKISYWLHSNGTHALNGYVMDMDGNKITGGEITFSKTTPDENNIVCNLSGTTVGTEYKIGLYQRGFHLRTNDITFYYE